MHCTRISQSWSWSGILVFLIAATVSRSERRKNHFFLPGTTDGLFPMHGLSRSIRRAEDISDGPALSKPATSEDELDFCLSSLQFVAVDGEVGEEEFILFVETFSLQPLHFDEFQELPPQLTLAFYTAACTGGRNCSTEKPKISLDTVGGAEMAILHIFCTSVKEVAIVQTSLKFQYQIRLVADGDDFSMARGDFPSNDDGLLVISYLEHATELVLLKELGCVGEADLGSRRKLRGMGSQDETWRLQSRAVSVGRLHSAAKDEVGRSQARNGRKMDCDYTVHAAVYRWHEMQCLPATKVSTSETETPIDDDEACILIFSEARVTAASLLQEVSTTDLRSTASAALKNAILSAEFDNLLAAQSLIPS